MIILAVETSCDDTCVAILEVKGRKNPHFKIAANVISSQVKLHAKYGGVYPLLAKREHQKNLPIVLKKALKEAKLPEKAIDFIAVTVGPGLEPCLWAGVNFAKELAKKIKAPLVPVNHIEAHIFANFVSSNSKFPEADVLRRYGTGKNQNSKLLPAICLVVSGGHTQLILMRDFGRYKILGETRDDAAGECFDKTARILELGYPGGPAIAAEARKYTGSTRAILPRPMIHQKNYDFSFSGLKTAVLYNCKSQPPKIRKSKQYIQAMCAEIQQAVIDVLIYKTIRAAKERKAKNVILGGGVVANEELQKQFAEIIKKEIPDSLFLIPHPRLCTDNAAMAATAAYYRWLKGDVGGLRNVKANANLKLV